MFILHLNIILQEYSGSAAQCFTFCVCVTYTHNFHVFFDLPAYEFENNRHNLSSYALFFILGPREVEFKGCTRPVDFFFKFWDRETEEKKIFTRATKMCIKSLALYPPLLFRSPGDLWASISSWATTLSHPTHSTDHSSLICMCLL